MILRFRFPIFKRHPTKSNNKKALEATQKSNFAARNDDGHQQIVGVRGEKERKSNRISSTNEM
jgi:hypothetical protein